MLELLQISFLMGGTMVLVGLLLLPVVVFAAVSVVYVVADVIHTIRMRYGWF